MRTYFLRATALCLLAPLAAGCPRAVDPTAADGSAPGVGRGTGYLADGADPFLRTDAADVDLRADARTWELTDGGTTGGDERYGALYVGYYPQGMDLYTYVSAEFRLSYRPDDPRCVTGSYGPWYFQDCAEGDAPLDTHPLPFPNVGPIRFDAVGQNQALEPGRDGSYPYVFVNEALYQPLQTVTVRAPGATVPGFTQPIDIPGMLDAEAPAGGVLDRGHDVTLRWTTPRAERVGVRLRQSYAVAGGASHAVSLTGEFYADEGAATLPASLLQRLHPEGPAATLNLTPYNRVRFMAGSFPVTLNAGGPSAGFVLPVQ